VQRIALKLQHSGSSRIVGERGWGKDGERGEEGIPDDSVISQGHTGLFMEISTLRMIHYKSTSSRKSNTDASVK
jgi:hypothetical protein